MKQRTLTHSVSLEGIAGNSGQAVRLRLRPAAPNHGIAFCRTDLEGSPLIQASVLAVSNLIRRTSIAAGEVEVHLIEHLMSALHGCEIDNVVVEINGPEAPLMDGSARPFVELIDCALPIEQEAERTYCTLDTPLLVSKGNSTLIALPADELRITCTAVDDRALIHTQHASLVVTPETYRTEIAPARTYILREDAEALKKAGGIRGGSLDNCIVLDGPNFLCNEPLRFPDELVRHKILDLVGDILLLGLPLKAHIIAVRAGHAINADFTRLLRERAMAELTRQ